MDPNQNVTGVLVKRGYLDTDINTEKMPCEEGRDQGDASTSCVCVCVYVCVCVCACVFIY